MSVARSTPAQHLMEETPPNPRHRVGAKWNSCPVSAVRLPVVLHGSWPLERGSRAVSSRHTSTVSKVSRGRGQHRERPQRADPGRGGRNNEGQCVLAGRGVSVSPVSVCLSVSRLPLPHSPSFLPAVLLTLTGLCLASGPPPLGAR